MREDARWSRDAVAIACFHGESAHARQSSVAERRVGIPNDRCQTGMRWAMHKGLAQSASLSIYPALENVMDCDDL